jgi:hypothetical protein
MGAADPPGHVHAHHHAQTPGPVDRGDLPDAGGDHLCHHAAAEEDEDHCSGELGEQFAAQSGDLESCRHVPSRFQAGQLDLRRQRGCCAEVSTR